jgi:hypothetical protein
MSAFYLVLLRIWTERVAAFSTVVFDHFELRKHGGSARDDTGHFEERVEVHLITCVCVLMYVCMRTCRHFEERVEMHLITCVCVLMYVCMHACRHFEERVEMHLITCVCVC